MRATKSASGTGKEMIDSTGFSQEKSAEGPPVQESEPLKGWDSYKAERGKRNWTESILAWRGAAREIRLVVDWGTNRHSQVSSVAGVTLMEGQEREEGTIAEKLVTSGLEMKSL